MKPLLDRIGLILVSLAVTFSIIIPLPYYAYTYFNNVYFIPYWTFIVWIIRGLGILALLAFGVYQLRRNRLRAPRSKKHVNSTDAIIPL